MEPRRLFVAGSTGATGRVFVPLARARGLDVVAHVRPRPGRPAGEGTVSIALEDGAALVAALRGRTTVVQLVGTMKKRFAQGDTYETSDVGTTRLLVEAARAAGTVDHVVLLSSTGAGRPRGAYLRAKAAAEALVTGSGLGWTVFRPSFLVGEDRRPPPGMTALTRALGLRTWEPISLEALSAAMALCAAERAPLGAVLEGESLFRLAGRAGPGAGAR